MPSPDHVAVIAAAGSHKTEYIVNQALSACDKRVLITTYTIQGLTCLIDRIEGKVGRVPDHITIMSWYQFLVSQWCRPYQRAVLGQPGLVRSIDFHSDRPRFIPRANPRAYYTNKAGDLYRNFVADFAVRVNEATNGASIRRLERIYNALYIDELQDLAGYDLDVLDVMLQGSAMSITMVGDPRQHTFSTNLGPRNKKYRGSGLTSWLDERSAVCKLEDRNVSFRCNQEICDFADALFPGLPATRSMNRDSTYPAGILMLKPTEVLAHVSTCRPAILRWSVTSNTMGLPAINFGASKGSTYDHVLIFPTETIRQYLKALDSSKLADGTRSKLYVAITRAKYSVAFVV